MSNKRSIQKKLNESFEYVVSRCNEFNTLLSNHDLGAAIDYNGFINSITSDDYDDVMYSLKMKITNSYKHGRNADNLCILAELVEKISIETELAVRNILYEDECSDRLRDAEHDYDMEPNSASRSWQSQCYDNWLVICNAKETQWKKLIALHSQCNELLSTMGI